MNYNTLFQTACEGILCGVGRQLYGMAIMVLCHICIAMPTEIPLMFLTSLRTEGTV